MELFKLLKVWCGLCGLLLLIASFIIGSSISLKVNYVADELCDIDGTPAWYVLHDEKGNTLGEFCLLDAIKYNMASTGYLRIFHAPIEVELLTFGPFILLGTILSLLFLEKMEWLLTKIWQTGIGALILFYSAVFLYFIVSMKLFA